MNDTVSGIVSIVAGIYVLLIAYRVVPISAKDEEKAELWHRKFGKPMKWLAPFVILFGVVQLLGLLRVGF